MFPMTVAERLDRTDADRSSIGWSDDEAAGAGGARRADLRGYVELASPGEASRSLLVALRASARRLDGSTATWSSSSRGTRRSSTGAATRRGCGATWRRTAVNSAGLVEDKTLCDAAGIDRRTALAVRGAAGEPPGRRGGAGLDVEPAQAAHALTAKRDSDRAGVLWPASSG